MVTLEDVHALATTLQASGETLSANKIVEHRGGSKRDALKLMRLYRAETPEPPTPGPSAAPVPPPAPSPVPVAPAPVPTPPAVVAPAPAPVPTLLAQAEEALQAARLAASRAKRDLDSAGRTDKERLEREWLTAKRSQETAATLLDQRQRAIVRLRAAIPGARVDARRTAGELAVIEDKARRDLTRARREAQQAQDELDRMIHDLVSIAGPQAVPAEEGV